MDNKTMARILCEVVENDLNRTFSELLDTYGTSDFIPEIIFEEIVKNVDMSMEEVKKMYECYVEIYQDKN